MSTQKESIEYILDVLEPKGFFHARAMFGEYALYAQDRVVALVCDDILFVKITDASNELEDICEKAPPYNGARPHYLVEESQISQINHLSEILIDIAKTLPAKKKPRAKKS